mmetsp:Transcript_20721/g.36860  ORF Transcript_20721/g.36860 Transcript_20721/m.36860 type:complete len:83 (-) Transcript_20721:562-810(-)
MAKTPNLRLKVPLGLPPCLQQTILPVLAILPHLLQQSTQLDLPPYPPQQALREYLLDPQRMHLLADLDLLFLLVHSIWETAT